MFSLRDFILKGIKGSIGKEPDYKVIQNTAGWLDKGVLEESDVEEISKLIDEQYTTKENTKLEAEV